jgi:hypothetical protein
LIKICGFPYGHIVTPAMVSCHQLKHAAAMAKEELVVAGIAIVIAPSPRQVA